MVHFAMPYGTIRVIVKRGIYRFTDAERKARRLLLIAKVTRHPDNESTNFKWNQPKQYFGNWQLAYNGIVMETGNLEYETECIWKYDADVNQILQHQHCLGVNINTNALKFYQGLRAAIAQSAADYQYEGVVKPTLLMSPFDEVWFSLFSNSTLQVQTYYEPLENLCGPLNAPTYKEPADEKPKAPNQPANPNPNRPGEDIPTDPYDPTTNDSGRTYDPDGFQGTGQWQVTATFADGSTIKAFNGDTNPNTKYSVGDRCWGDPDPGPSGNPSGFKIYKNGQYFYCSIDPARGSIQTWNAEFIVS